MLRGPSLRLRRRSGFGAPALIRRQCVCHLPRCATARVCASVCKHTLCMHASYRRSAISAISPAVHPRHNHLPSSHLSRHTLALSLAVEPRTRRPLPHPRPSRPRLRLSLAATRPPPQTATRPRPFHARMNDSCCFVSSKTFADSDHMTPRFDVPPPRVSRIRRSLSKTPACPSVPSHPCHITQIVARHEPRARDNRPRRLAPLAPFQRLLVSQHTPRRCYPSFELEPHHALSPICSPVCAFPQLPAGPWSDMSAMPSLMASPASSSLLRLKRQLDASLYLRRRRSPHHLRCTWTDADIWHTARSAFHGYLPCASQRTAFPSDASSHDARSCLPD